MTSDGSDTGPSRIGRLPKLIRFVLTVVIATVLGPLIGGVAPFLVTAMQLAQSGAGAAEIARSFIPIVIFAYVVGWVIAFVAGTIVAVAALWRQPTFVVIIAATVVANVGCFMAGQQTYDWLFINLPVSAFAATICWLLFRRLLRNT